MRALITGRQGTVGTALAHLLSAQGHTAIGWDRGLAPPLAFETHASYLDHTAPDVLFHLGIASQSTQPDEPWRVNVEWSSELASLCAARGIAFVFTSSALVFDNRAVGPFTVRSTPNASTGYGHEKRVAETRVQEAHADAKVVRLGWQIGEGTAGNQMLAFAATQMRDQGVVRTSTRWLPACSMLTDTCAALMRVLELPAGLYLADSNSEYSFFEIMTALREQLGTGWQIEPNQDYVYDQRLIDPRLGLPGLAERLPALALLRGERDARTKVVPPVRGV